MTEKETSDLSMTRVECPHCESVWINGQHYWKTGCKGSELDLAGLVCNNHGDERCINPKRGQEGGDSWEKRLAEIDRLLDEKMNQ